MDWLCSLVSCIMLWLMGNNSKWGPVVGLFGQIIWCIFAIRTQALGLLPGVIIFAIIHARNVWKWWGEK